MAKFGKGSELWYISLGYEHQICLLIPLSSFNIPLLHKTCVFVCHIVVDRNTKGESWELHLLSTILVLDSSCNCYKNQCTLEHLVRLSSIFDV
jgi:hypothetical protein